MKDINNSSLTCCGQCGAIWDVPKHDDHECDPERKSVAFTQADKNRIIDIHKILTGVETPEERQGEQHD